jgi:hypothetical protein
VAEACSASPREFAETVQKLIRAERAKTPKKPEKTQQLTPFFILLRIAKCWNNSAVRDLVLAELQDSENSAS